jgi:HEPN domain-containing protein
MLLSNLPESIKPIPELVDKAKELDHHYITSRYPNSHPTGAPFEYYTKSQAERSIQYADEIIRFCEDKISG